jgi:hypothetical protein
MLKEAIRIHFFNPGFSWTRRAVRFIPYVVPQGCMPSASRYIAFPDSDKTYSLLGLAASNVASAFLRFYGEKFHFPNYMVETVKRLPWPQVTPEMTNKFEELIRGEVENRRKVYQCEEPFHEFLMPHRVWAEPIDDGILEFEYSSILPPELDSQVAESFTLDVDQFSQVTTDLSEALAIRNASGDSEEEIEEKEDKDFVINRSPSAQNEALFSYFVGTAFGRWDIRYAIGERQPPELPDPFDPLPVCPPGMLQNAEGLPAEPKDVPADFPLRISWPGILVDDENHRSKEGHCEDIVARVRESIEVIWKDRAEAIEQEACEILGVKTLRDYFRRPAAFFADHLKRYSKSRRQAPIYWPLSTKTGSYTLWLYYHRLTDQSLHTCLADFLDPKIRKVQTELDSLTGSGVGGSRVGDLREFLDELKDLHDEIERIIKLPWKPNLNDGVLITASSLWKLFRLPKWQKDLKACWDKLAKGEYDWAHLAYSIRPREVEKACEKDRSIAIAHGLEHLCKVQPPKPNKKRGKKKASEEEPEDEEPELIEED